MHTEHAIAKRNSLFHLTPHPLLGTQLFQCFRPLCHKCVQNTAWLPFLHMLMVTVLLYFRYICSWRLKHIGALIPGWFWYHFIFIAIIFTSRAWSEIGGSATGAVLWAAKEASDASTLVTSIFFFFPFFFLPCSPRFSYTSGTKELRQFHRNFPFWFVSSYTISVVSGSSISGSSAAKWPQVSGRVVDCVSHEEKFFI